MDLIFLEESLEELLPSGFSIETDSRGQIIIHTGLMEEEEGGELVTFSEDIEDSDEDNFNEDE